MFCCSSPVGQNLFVFEKNYHMIELILMHTYFVTDSLFVAQRESRFRLHCAIRVQNHQLFTGENFWQFIVKVRGGQVLRE